MAEKIWRQIGRIADALSIGQALWPWIGFVTVMAAGLSWAASAFDLVAAHGWGAMVFAGVTVAAIVVLVIAAGMASWRYFRPTQAVANFGQADKKLIVAKARTLVVSAAVQNLGDLEFRATLEASAAYYQVRPHLSKNFTQQLSSVGRVIYTPGVGDTVCGIARCFADDIDRLEREWKLI